MRPVARRTTVRLAVELRTLLLTVRPDFAAVDIFFGMAPPGQGVYNVRLTRSRRWIGTWLGALAGEVEERQRGHGGGDRVAAALDVPLGLQHGARLGVLPAHRRQGDDPLQHR